MKPERSIRPRALLLLAFLVPIPGPAAIDDPSAGSSATPAAPASAPVSLIYRFDEVRSRVTVLRGEAKRAAKETDEARAGDEVESGWFGRAVLSVPDRASRFEILSSTHVLLGGPEPGILVRLEKGRLRAVFDAFTGRDERLVSTPGAILAVRGTRYELEVDSSGDATLAVFEGTVEVRSRLAGGEPLAVGAGNICRIGRDSRFEQRRMPPGMSEEGGTRHQMDRGRDPGQPGAMGGHRDSSTGGHGGH